MQNKKTFNGTKKIRLLSVAIAVGLAVSNAGFAGGASAGSYNPQLLQECQKQCSTIRQKDEKDCKSRFKNDDPRQSSCIKGARDDEDRCDASCAKKYGK